jgi:SET domain-containing protein 6
VATGDLAEDEIIFSIPRSALLNINTAFSTSGLSSLQANIQDMPSWLVSDWNWYDLEQPLISPQVLTAIILGENGQQDSKWAPYLAILPRQLDNLVFWSHAELSELQASKVVSKIGKSGAEDAFSKSIAPLGFADYNIEECHRVASVIMSYAFDIPETHTTEEENVGDEGDDLVSDDEEDEKTILSMIPLADMLCVYPCTVMVP